MSLAMKPDIISFAGGMPDNNLLPVQDIDRIYHSLTLREKQTAMQYSPTSGLPSLLQSLHNYLKEKGFPLKENKLLITTGSTQAINILTKYFVNPNDPILVENPCFIGALSAFDSYQANIISIPLNEDGIDIEYLNNQLKKQKPKFIYLTPNFHNPAGILYSYKTKEKLIEKLQGLDIPIIEDDVYNELFFFEEDKKHLKSIKEINPEGIDVCYTGSFSKLLGPGLRLGWLLVPNHIYEECEIIKQSFDACSPSFTQVIADKFLRSGYVYNYIDKVKKEYRKRAKAMEKALKKHFPDYAKWVTPRGGFYFWIELPKNIDVTEVLKKSIEKGAVFVTGKTFDPEGKINNAFRISYSNSSIEKINEGIPIIAEAIKEVCEDISCT